MSNEYSSIVQTLLGLPIFHSEWVLYLLLGLSLLSIAVMIERWKNPPWHGSNSPL